MDAVSENSPCICCLGDIDDAVELWLYSHNLAGDASLLNEPSDGMREIVWLGDSFDELRSWPRRVQRDVGSALFVAQHGAKDPSAVPLKGFGGASVLEIKADDSDGTYRLIYTVKLADAIYVLHAFQKKSTRGIQTSQRDLDLIERRLAVAIDESRSEFARRMMKND
jgi:phage-related protein